MNSLRRTIKFQNLDLIQLVGVFWAVILIIDVSSYILMSIYGNQFFGISSGYVENGTSFRSISVAAANIMPIVIFFVAYCYEMYYEYFPVAIGFSTTRKSFYKSVVINNIIVTSIFSVVQSILMKLDGKIISSMGRNPMVDFGIFNVSTDSLVFTIFSLLILFLSITSMLNLLASLNYKFGFKLWIAIGVVFSLTTAFIGTPFLGFINRIFTWRIDSLQLIILCITIIACNFIAYRVISNTNIKNKIG